MKLIDLVSNLIKLDEANFSTLDSESLIKVKDFLSKCDELKNVEDLKLIKLPDLINDKDEIIYSSTFKLTDNISFGKKCYIHSISKLPAKQDFNAKYEPVKDGVFITPTEYEPSTLTPIRYICVRYSPEEISDRIAFGESINNIKMEYRALFKRVLDSPEEYYVKTEDTYVIRGIFDEITVNGITTKQDISNLCFEIDEQKYFMVMYSDIITNGIEAKLALNKKYLSNDLKPAFLERFKEVQRIITKKELGDFLNCEL